MRRGFGFLPLPFSFSLSLRRLYYTTPPQKLWPSAQVVGVGGLADFLCVSFSVPSTQPGASSSVPSSSRKRSGMNLRKRNLGRRWKKKNSSLCLPYLPLTACLFAFWRTLHGHALLAWHEQNRQGKAWVEWSGWVSRETDQQPQEKEKQEKQPFPLTSHTFDCMRHPIPAAVHAHGIFCLVGGTFLLLGRAGTLPYLGRLPAAGRQAGHACNHWKKTSLSLSLTLALPSPGSCHSSLAMVRQAAGAFHLL